MGLHSRGGGGGLGTQAHNFSSGESYEVNLLNDYQISLHPDDPDSVCATIQHQSILEHNFFCALLLL